MKRNTVNQDTDTGSNLYVYPDENEYVYAEENDHLYSIEDVESEPSEEERGDSHHPVSLLLLLKVMMTPVEGWKALRRARIPVDVFARKCFYPIASLAAFCVGAKFFYEPDISFTEWVVEGLCTFLTFFFGYFTSLIASSIILPKAARPLVSDDTGKEMLMLAMSTLAFFSVIRLLVPMLEPVLVFLPIWTLYLVFKAVRVFHVPEDCRTSTTGLLCMIVLGSPLLWDWIFDFFL